MTQTEMLKLAAQMQTDAEVNPTRHSDLLKQGAAVIVELVIKVRVYEEIDKQRKLS
jgi:hypothetical protein